MMRWYMYMVARAAGTYVRTYIYVGEGRTDQENFSPASALFFDKNKEIFASRPRPSAARSKSLPAALNRRMQDLGYSDPFDRR